MITVPNFRDVAASFVRDATRITPGRLYRSATPWLASAEDISYMTDELGIKLVLDLRTATEQRQGDAAGESKGVLARMFTLSGHNGNDDSMRCVRAPLLNEDRFARIMFRRARFTTKLAMLTVAVDFISRKIGVRRFSMLSTRWDYSACIRSLLRTRPGDRPVHARDFSAQIVAGVTSLHQWKGPDWNASCPHSEFARLFRRRDR